MQKKAQKAIISDKATKTVKIVRKIVQKKE